MITPFTDQQWWMISDFVSQPCELHEAGEDLEKDFIYDRKYGFMVIAHPGAHEIAMRQLLAFHNDCEDSFDLAEKWGRSGIHADEDFPEKWLEIPGNAFKSTVSHHLRIGYNNSLNAQEKIVFKDFEKWPMLEEK